MFLIILIISIETLTMRVLITVPTKSGYGGVTNYYLGIKEYCCLLYTSDAADE